LTVQTKHLDYDLPRAAIAEHPSPIRGQSRLLGVGSSWFSDLTMGDWPELVPKGSLVVLNDTRVRQARLLGQRWPSGGKVELLMLEPSLARVSAGERWFALGRANRPLRSGTRVRVQDGELLIVERLTDGRVVVEYCGGESVEELLRRHGRVPLPPYIQRADEPEDALRYQTVFAKNLGAVAAPTAALHLTDEMLRRLANRGITIGKLTLHVGVGTFAPVKTADLRDHAMHAEYFRIDSMLAEQVSQARQRAGSVVAVGTTVVRALESAKLPGTGGLIEPTERSTHLLIEPGFVFGVVDALLTNFHAPKSTLLALVAAFAGLTRMQEAYRVALKRGYRFLSYGDAMWLPNKFV
jgi:S-adenosylmethionine:tRNA ribosyltransferase-isomerase